MVNEVYLREITTETPLIVVTAAVVIVIATIRQMMSIKDYKPKKCYLMLR